MSTWVRPFAGVSQVGDLLLHPGVVVDFIAVTGDAAPPPPPVLLGRSHRVLAYENEGGKASYTDAEAIDLAGKFDVLTVQSTGGYQGTKFSPARIDAMKLENPRLQIGPYMNGGPQPQSTNFPEAWYAHDAAGNRCGNENDPGQLWGPKWLMEPSNADWRAWIGVEARRIYDLSKRANGQSAYDFIFIDVLGLPQWGALKFPVIPGTQTRYTKASFADQTAKVGASIRAACRLSNPAAYAIANGLKYGIFYPAETKRMLMAPDGLDGGMSELWTRTPEESINRPLDAFKKDLAMVLDMQANNKRFFGMVKDWTGDPIATRTERIKFGLFTFLLVDDGTGWIAVSLGQATSRDAYPWLNHTAYGTPSAPFAINAAGVYTRKYSQSTVVVNPTDVAWSGTVEAQSVTVGAHRGTAVMAVGA